MAEQRPPENELLARFRAAPEAYWLGGLAAAFLLALAARVGWRQGWRALTAPGMQWLRLARALLRAMQLAAEISRPKRADES